MARAMRPILIVPGILILVVGVVFALQGAGLVPTTFMTGPTWIAIGSGVAVLGGVLTVLGARTG